VPQGSNLGPLLFLLAINGIIRNIKNAKALLLADDFKCFLQIDSIFDCEILQNDFCDVANWCDVNSFKLNVGKCACMSFTLNNNPITYNYTLNHEPLQRVTEHKDLGLIFDTTLSFTGHILSKVESAHKIAGFIVRSTSKLSVEVSFHLFDSLVLPILEYGSIIWSPQYDVWVAVIEGVQRRFLKCMYYRTFGIYPQRGCDNGFLLETFNRLSLNKRRIKIFLCTLFKLLKNEVDCPELLEQLPFAINRMNSRNSNIFYLAYPRTNLYKNSPIYKLCYYFNFYASDIDIDSTSLNRFKKIILNKLKSNVR